MTEQTFFEVGCFIAGSLFGLLVGFAFCYAIYQASKSLVDDDAFDEGVRYEKRAQAALPGVTKSIGLVVLLCVALAASDASACIRCGLSGHRCAFVAHQHHAAVVAAVVPAAVVKQPEVLVINNLYPPSNGSAGQTAPLTAPQGNTVYGYTLSQAFQPVDPNVLAQSILNMQQAANAGAQLAYKGAADHLNLQLQVSHAQTQPLIQAQAAQQVLDAAGVNPARQQLQASTPSSLRIYRDTNGQYQVEQLTAPQVAEVNQRSNFLFRFGQATTNAQQPAGTTPPTTPVPAPAPAAKPADDPFPAPPANPNSLVATKCFRCHGGGTTAAAPGGGLYIGDGQPLDCDIAKRAQKAIRSGKMPKGEALSPQEKLELIGELVDLAK